MSLDATLVAQFVKAGVPDEVQSLVQAKGICSIERFANSVDTKAEVKAMYLNGTPLENDTPQLAALKMAWRECESLVERGLVLTKTVVEPTELGDFEVPLPTSVQQDLEQQFLKRYSWLRISSHSVGCDTLLGRVQREFLRRTPTVFRISRVRTRAQSAVSTSAKRQKISDQMSIHFNSGEPEERRISGVLEFLRQLRVFGNTWAMAGNFFVTWQGKEVLYCHWGHVTEYITELEGRVLELRHSYTDSSVCSWLAAVEEDFRAKAVELARAPDGPAPWGLALLDAVRELHSKWDQRRDFLVLVGAASRVPQPPGSSGVPRVKREHVPKGPSKGTGKRGRKSDLARPVSPPRDDPLRLNDGTGARGSWKHATMWGRKQLCKSWNDQRGCSGKCGREHRCDVVLSNNEPCGSKDHRRLQHDPRTHGVPINRS